MLRALEYRRHAAVAPNALVAEKIALVVSKRDGDGRWPLETRYTGAMPVTIGEGEGRGALLSDGPPSPRPRI